LLHASSTSCKSIYVYGGCTASTSFNSVEWRSCEFHRVNYFQRTLLRNKYPEPTTEVAKACLQPDNEHWTIAGLYLHFMYERRQRNKLQYYTTVFSFLWR
jgi:hypothetical protein